MQIIQKIIDWRSAQSQKSNLKMLLRDIRKIALMEKITDKDRKILLEKVELALLENERS